MRPLDHIVLCVDDLERARASYAALGFTLTPPADHPFGTRNSLVQLAGRNFLELLAIRDRSVIPPRATLGHFSFAGFNAAFLERCGEGASMVALVGRDTRADAAGFRAAGLETYEPFDFGRAAVQPDGSVARLGFSLAFVTHPAMPDLAFFTCQHRHAPELFWKPAYQGHANGAEGVREVILSAPEPALCADFLHRLSSTDAPPDRAVADWINVLGLDALAARYPEWSGRHQPRSPRLVACRIAVADLNRTRRHLDDRAVPYRFAPASLVVPPASAHGLCWEFSEGGTDPVQAAAA